MNQIYNDSSPNFELEFLHSSTTIENISHDITATFALVLNAMNKILVIKNERGWDIPGGHLEPGETVIEATHREVLEETCVSISGLELFALIKNETTAMSVFVAKPDKIYEFVPSAEDPTSDRQWMLIADFMRVYSGGVKVIMDQLLDTLSTHFEQ